MPNSLMEAMKDKIQAFPKFSELSDLLQIESMDTNPDNSGLFTSGRALEREYCDGSSVVIAAFYLQSSLYSVEDTTRLENSALIEEFTDWLDDQNREAFELPEGYEFVSISNGGGLSTDYTEDGQGIIYRILIQITYERTK